MFSAGPLAVVEFVDLVQPFHRHAFGDGVLAVAGGNDPIVLAAVAHLPPLARPFLNDLALVVNIEAIAEGGRPPQQPDHLLKFLPAAEVAVGGMDQEHTAAAANVVDEILLGNRFRPHLAFVVQHHAAELAELRPPGVPLLRFTPAGGVL